MNIRKRSPVHNDSQNRKTKIIIITGDEQLINHFQQNTNGADTQMFDLDQTNFNGNIRELALLSELTDHNEIDDHIYRHMLRSPSTNNKAEVRNPTVTPSTTKSKRSELVCVVCGGKALGYNYDAITCMRKDFILTPEEKSRRRKRLEENNRRFSHGDIVTVNEEDDSDPKYNNSTGVVENLMNSTTAVDSGLLTDIDHLQLKYIEESFINAYQSTAIPSLPLQIKDKMDALTYVMDIQNFTALRLINYLKTIPEFEALDENDRFLLVKYNLVHVFILAKSLFYDHDNGVCNETVENLKQRKEIFILCHGDEIRNDFLQLVQSVKDTTENDPSIIHLLIIVIIFTKGLSLDNSESILSNYAQ
ncbi:unnamed protein product, partial [Didymodactylos carnosus]